MRRVGAWSRVAVAAMAGSVSPATGRAYGVARVCAVWGVPLLAAIGAGNRVRSAPSGATPPRACAPRSSAGPARAAPPPARRSAPSPRSGVSRLGISEASILGRPSTNGCPRKRGPAQSLHLRACRSVRQESGTAFGARAQDIDHPRNHGVIESVPACLLSDPVNGLGQGARHVVGRDDDLLLRETCFG
jgi:hypothetical protein